MNVYVPMMIKASPRWLASITKPSTTTMRSAIVDISCLIYKRDCIRTIISTNAKILHLRLSSPFYGRLVNSTTANAPISPSLQGASPSDSLLRTQSILESNERCIRYLRQKLHIFSCSWNSYVVVYALIYTQTKFSSFNHRLHSTQSSASSYITIIQSAADRPVASK